jgi:transposase-like protein/uncharacterized protein YbaR (Trm112 family)
MLCWLILFICRYIPLKQWAYDEANSPEYQKFTVDKLPIVKQFYQQDWRFLLEYYQWRGDKPIKPIQRRNGKTIPEDITCPLCNAPHQYIYDNNGSNGQYKCKICSRMFNITEKAFPLGRLACPYCRNLLVKKKERKIFNIHKCINKKCSFYLNNLKKVKKKDLEEEYGKNKYKLHYIYREFMVEFFPMKPESLPKNASSLRFSKNNAYIMGLCLTYHVNLQLSLRKTAQALYDIHSIKISHQQVANYAKTAAVLIKPFVDNFDYKPSNTYIADETYIKVKGVKGYVWLIMDAVSRSILGYLAADNRSVGPCIQVMQKAFRGLEELPEGFRFITDGYSAYPLAALHFAEKLGAKFTFNITQVIGLTNDDAVSKEFRPFKQMIERLNRTYKLTYRVNCGYDNFEGANYNVSLWVAYYNFLRTHQATKNKVLNKVEILENAENMPGKWQLLIFLGQQTIMNLESQSAS